MTMQGTALRLAKKAAIVAAGLGAAGAVIVPASPAMACAVGDACLYSNAGRTGHHYETFYSTPNLGNVVYDDNKTIKLYAGDGVGNNVSGLDNWDFDHPVAVYYNSGYRGPCFQIPAGGAALNFAALPKLSNGKSPNDNMNSFHFNYTC